MKLSKSDALFLYGVLFHQSSTKSLGYSEEDRLQDLLNSLSEYVLGDSVETQADDHDHDALDDESDDVDQSCDDEDDEDSDDEEEDVPEVEDIVKASALAALPAVTVVSPTGSKVSLEFEDIGDENSVDALLDEGSMIIDSVTHIKLNSDSIELYDSAEWHKFTFKKASKAWGKQLNLGVVYGVGWSSTSSKEEEE